MQSAGGFTDKVALVTGAARGQGRAHALALAEQGADLILLDICRQLDTVPYPLGTRAELDETAALIGRLDRRAVVVEADIRDGAEVQHGIDEACATLGRLDIVCANAGIFSTAPVTQLDERSWRDVIDTNLSGQWFTVRASIPHIVATGRGGSIVLTSSVTGLKAVENIAAYASAKHGLVGLMRSLALELAPSSIRVNSVHPSTVATPMVQNDATYRLMRPDLEAPTLEDAIDVQQGMNALPVPWIEPEDVTAAVMFLLSDQARFITGVALPVDAGFMLK